MSQISMPVRILLIGAVVFLAAWFTVLRPKPASVDAPSISAAATVAPSSTPQTAFGKAVAKAKAAADATSTPVATTTATTAAPAATPTPAAAVTIPAHALAKLPKDVAGALTSRKVLVLGVLSDEISSVRPLADDDRYVRNALRKVNRYRGEVLVKQVGINQLSTYGGLVNDLHVSQSPSVVVIDGNLKGTVLTGFVDRVAIDQAIADARRYSITPNLGDAYLHKANSICGHYETSSTRWSHPTIRGARARRAATKRLVAVVTRYRNEIARTPAPAKWRSLKRQWVRVMTARVAAAKHGGFVSVDREDARSLDQRFNDVGLTDCAYIRRS